MSEVQDALLEYAPKSCEEGLVGPSMSSPDGQRPKQTSVRAHIVRCDELESESERKSRERLAGRHV